jgi:hypothetical protein
VLALVDPGLAGAVGQAMVATAHRLSVPGRLIQTEITALGAAVDHDDT